MPELPEVETIIRRLRGVPVAGRIIQFVQVTWDRSVAKPDPNTFHAALIGKTISDARRRGKFLHFPLNEGHLIAHLRMSGDMRMEKRITLGGQPIPPQAHDRIILNLDSDWRLAFSNTRKFGRMWYVDDPQTVFGYLGPEPLSGDFTPELLYEILHHHSRMIKPLLMDQGFVAGLGNIYTDESLFRAKLHPLRKSDTISKTEAGQLFQSIQAVLKEGIRRSGASLDWVYLGGDFQNSFKVYQQDGEPCPDCGSIVQKITVGQRGTHLCPNCQKLPDPT